MTGEESTEDTQENGTCFVIAPIGEEGSDLRSKIDGLINEVFEDVLVDNENIPISEIEVAHEIDETGSITQQIVERIINSKLVLADLTHQNPNVTYELAIRHACQKPTILICEDDPSEIVFDLNDERAITYDNDVTGIRKLKNELKRKAKTALKDDEHDNPISRWVQMNADILNFEKISSSNDQISEFYKEFMELKSKLTSQESSISPKTLETSKPSVEPSFEFLVDKIEETHSTAAALLSEAKHVFYEDGELFVVFERGYEYHRDKLDGMNDKLEGIVEKHLDEKVSMECFVKG